MFRNIILAIFLLVLAIPSMAAPMPAPMNTQINDGGKAAASCHDAAPATPDETQHHGGTAKHSCIGCIALIQKASLLEPSEMKAMSPAPVALPALTGIFPPPATPPPRA